LIPLADSPQISVLLPVHNCEFYVKQSIQSILDQSFIDFELIIIDDGSTDNSFEIIKGFEDQRIRVFTQSNQGLSATLNRGISLSRSSLIARQDADDISLPNRLKLQVDYMHSHPEIVLLGSAAQIIDKDKLVNRFRIPPLTSKQCRYTLLFENCFTHTSIIIRKFVFDEIGVYSTSKNRQPPEDYELWSRISRCFEIANLPDKLVLYRESPNSLCRRDIADLKKHLITISSENLSYISGRKADDLTALSMASIYYGPPFFVQFLPNLFDMKSLLNKALRTIDPEQEFPELRRNIDIRILSLFFYWIVKCSPLKYMLILMYPLKPILYKISSYFKSSVHLMYIDRNTKF
tara:strand:+ start:29 stop:1075 length:1047 start_codon:yes stop_codon:yes gene_type:complete